MSEEALQACVDRHLAHAALVFMLDDELGTDPAKRELQAALAFYLIYISGLLALVVIPATSWRQALTRGAMLGAMAYATYDLTNQATLKVWSTRITLLDISWGTFLTGVSALGGYLILKWARRAFP